MLLVCLLVWTLLTRAPAGKGPDFEWNGADYLSSYGYARFERKPARMLC